MPEHIGQKIILGTCRKPQKANGLANSRVLYEAK